MFKKLNKRSVACSLSHKPESSKLTKHTTDQEWQEYLNYLKNFFSSQKIAPLFESNLPDNRAFIKVNILGTECLALADSGASTSILSSDALGTLRELGLQTHLQPSSKTLKVGNNANLNILGSITIPITYKSELRLITLNVCTDINSPLILGVDFLRAFNLCQDILEYTTDSQCPSAFNSLTDTNTHLHAYEDLLVEQKSQIDNIITDFKSISADSNNLGLTDLEEHVIDTGDHPPMKQKYYPIPVHYKQRVEAEINDMLRMGIIEKSNSPWNSPLLVVPKPNGDLRICLDSRKLNSVTKIDSYPMPRIQDILDSLNNAKFLSSIDLKSAFFQINLHPDSREKTSFSIPGVGAFQFCRMPFGLVNASARMMRLMDKVFGPEFAGRLFTYIDDIILVSNSYHEHVDLLKRVYQRLKEVGLTINFEKSVFCRSSLKFLGFIVDRHGLRTDSDKVKAILEYPVPTNQKEVRRFLGMASWYRRFIQNFSLVTAPINSLIKKQPKGKAFSFPQEAILAFNEIKQRLVSAPILSIPKFDKPFIISTDASDLGLGCVLSQKDDEGKEHPVAFASRSLTKPERNHATTEKELNALIFALEKFRGYIEGSPFPTTIYTDHSSLKWLVSLKSPTGRLARWAVRLSQFNLKIEYRRGSDNALADALSRSFPVNVTSDDDPPQDYPTSSSTTKDSWYHKKVQDVKSSPHKFADWKLISDRLYKRMRNPNPLSADCEWKLVVPFESRHDVLAKCHDHPSAAHLGTFKTLKRLTQSYYWPSLHRDVKKYIKNCQVCLAYKSTNEGPPGIMKNPKQVQRPFQMISTDIMGPLPRSYQGYKFILVVTDVFTKYACIFPMRNSLAKTVVSIIENNIFMKYGIPQTIVMDNGPQYISNAMKDLVAKYKIPNSFYNCRFLPQNNPSERTNRVIVTAISSYVGTDHRKWAEELPKIEFAINTAVSESTGFSPYFLNHGREAVLSGDWYPNSPLKEEDILFTDRTSYSSTLPHLKDIFIKVNLNMSKAYSKYKIHYNKNRRDIEYQEGQTVWKKEYPLSDANKFFTAKLAPKFTKCIVKKKISPLTYILKDFHTSKDLGTWHIKDILKSVPI